ncbi:histone H3 [Colletotrichum truncatum]|uniref:Histone H3 n=1 Tax=Colletotrichum truncatum TaxID=5467 RepID=A0ACC3YQC8_COLTU|nr:histone H3 [Colletotrichum truncatum]KAF6796662.1 histone H3 [Colletotrichum truncatum]
MPRLSTSPVSDQSSPLTVEGSSPPNSYPSSSARGNPLKQPITEIRETPPRSSSHATYYSQASPDLSQPELLPLKQNFATKLARRTDTGQPPTIARKDQLNFALKKQLKAARKKPVQITKRQKVRRWRPGTNALREIRKYQKTTNLLIPRSSFARVVREITLDLPLRNRHKIRYQSMAIEALHEMSEQFLINMFENANLCAIHAKRVTLQKKDLDLVKQLMKKMGAWSARLF